MSDAEGLPTVAMEVFATGIPVLSRDVGDIREVVIDGVTGYVVTSASPRAIAASFSKARELRIPTHARKLLLARFPWDHLANRLVELYEESLCK